MIYRNGWRIVWHISLQIIKKLKMK
jgi:hypothetical protein